MTSRVKASLLTVGLGAIATILAHEGFSDKAIIPVKGDVPTIGYGTTTRQDGSPVRMGDTTTEPEARRRAVADINNVYATGVKKCLGETLVYQHEFDALVDGAYNLGIAAICKSGMVRHFKTGNYTAGCEYFLEYRFFIKKNEKGQRIKIDCFLPENKKTCGGIKSRREYQYQMCMGLL